jgi:ABC-2 type transport system permease protein
VAKDRMALVWFLIMPLTMAYVFGGAFRGYGPNSTWIPVIDLDQHELSGLFVEQLRQQDYYIEMRDATNQWNLKHGWPYGVVIAKGFGERLLGGGPVDVTFVKGGGTPEKILEVQSCLYHAVVRFTKGLALADTCHRPWDEASRAALKEALARPQLLTVARATHRTLKPPPAGLAQSLPGMLVMFVVQMILTYGGTTLVNDRLGGQLRRVLATPVTWAEAYAGKILARVLLGCLQAAVLLGAGVVLFKFQLGDHAFFVLPVVICLALFAGAASMVAGAVCKSEKQVIVAAIFGTMLLAALGGCWWPIEVVPEAFKTVAMATPTYWAIHGLQSVLYFGHSYEVLAVECPVLLGFAGLTAAIALLLARSSR